MMPSDHGSQLDELRDVVGEIDALAALAVDSLDDTEWRGADRLLVKRMAYVLGMIARSAATASSRLDAFLVAVADTQPATSGDQWSGGAGRTEPRERRSISITLASVEQLLRVGAAHLDEGRTHHPASTRSQPAIAVRVTKLSPDAKGPHPEPQQPQKPQEQRRVIANEDERHVIANNLHAHEMKVLWTLRNRCAEVFRESPYHPFFRENYRPGEDPSTALLRMFKHLQFCGSLNDEETISALARRSLR